MIKQARQEFDDLMEKAGIECSNLTSFLFWTNLAPSAPRGSTISWEPIPYTLCGGYGFIPASFIILSMSFILVNSAMA